MALLDKVSLYCKKNNIEVIEDHFKLEFIDDQEEAFLTGTAVEITPISSIDKQICYR